MSAIVSAGQLRCYVSVQQRSSTQNSFGEAVNTWTEIKKVFAAIEGVSMSERFGPGAVAVEVTHNITVRYDAIFMPPTAGAALRIVYNGRIFDLHGIENEDEMNRMLTITASEGLTVG